MPNTTLPLNIVCNVAVSVSPIAAATPTFNQGLIIGPSNVIPTTGANSRLRQYTGLAGMTADGFTSAMPEYLAAQLYFGQTPAPIYLWIGAQGTTESALTALTACRIASPAWWACLVTSAATADHEAIAPYVQAMTPQGCYFYTTSDAAVLAGTAGNVLLTLQAGLYSRSFGLYSSTPYASAAAMGAAMGLNTGLANSNYTMKFKVLTGVTPEPLTQTQVLSIEAAGGNLYLSYANTYSWLEQGVVSDGQFFDEILNIDMLASDIQYSVANALISSPSIPHTNAGETVLISYVNGACGRSLSRGFIAPGIWNGQQVLNLLPGEPLPKGYLSQADSFANQSASARAARQAMPIYVTLCEAGAMHSITIGVYVQR